MNPHEEFGEILRRVAPLPASGKGESLLDYFSRAIQTMDTLSLMEFRDFCAAQNEETDAEVTMLEIIDGQLALREIAARPDASDPEM
ncbi:MAG: hypothetical protein Q7S40_03435 [Opitutaceae bacterium]|nr:hypothetical protein [Opitutaceae bacterium]